MPPLRLRNRLCIQAPLFVDSLLLLLRAGSGGDGCSSFARAKYIPYGPPSGGHGGKGGDIYVRAVSGLTSLSKLGSGGISSSGSASNVDDGLISDATSGTIRAGTGSHGTGSFRDGKKGKDRILEVPVGTICKVFRGRVWDWNEEEFQRETLRKQYEDSLIESIGKTKVKNHHGGQEQDLEQKVDDEESQYSRSERMVQMEEARHQDEEAARLREQRDLVWRHYPRGGPSAEEQEAEDAYRRNEFEIAEERLALALQRERREKATQIKAMTHDRNQLNSQRRLSKQKKTWEADVSGFRFAAEEDLEVDEEKDSNLQIAGQDHKDTTQVGARSIRPEVHQSPEQEEEQHPLFTIDFSSPTLPDSPGYLIASGGSGGYGNPFFLTSQNRSPKFATRGQRGETTRLQLELKVPADIGFVGMPNVGKSSLLQALTGAGNASAKVGDFSFTTLNPNIGVVRLDREHRLIGTGQGRIGGKEERELERWERSATAPSNESFDLSSHQDQTHPDEAHRLTILDLPGLLEDASKDVGLGHSFLRHAERCPLLVYVVDISTKVPEPWKDVQILKKELEAYKPGLSERARLVIANKADALGPPVGLESQYKQSGLLERENQIEVERLSEEEAKEKLETLTIKVKELVGPNLQVLPISAMWRLGVQSLAKKLKDLLDERSKDEEEHGCRKK